MATDPAAPGRPPSGRPGSDPPERRGTPADGTSGGQSGADERSATGSGGYPHPPNTNGFAIAALICGVLGVTAILAVAFGVVARRQIARTGDRGDGMAKAGIVLGVLWLAAVVLVLIVAGTTHPIVGGGRLATA